MTLTASQAASLMGLRYNITDPTPLSYLLTDSRDVCFPKETIFFALRTSGNNGHNYIKQLYDKGVRYFVIDQDVDFDACPDAHFLRTTDVLSALQRLGEGLRQQASSIPVIGITGSRGKTVVKEYLYQMLSGEYDIARSPRSYNSQIGVPLSLWEMTPDTSLAIFEAGISMPGEMEKLERIIKPSIGVFTSLTDEHSTDFKSLLQKAREKALLFKDAQKVYYHADEDGIILQALTEKAPNAQLVPVTGDFRDLAMTVAKSLGNKTMDVPSLKISPRIDVSETLKNCLIIFDGYTNDCRSIRDALNAAKRHVSSNRKFTVVLQWPQAVNANQATLESIFSLLKAKDVKRLIAIGFPMQLPEAEGGIAIEVIGSIADFEEKYTISDFNDEVILVKGNLNNGYERIKTLLEAPRHETVMEVDLDAIIHNFNLYRSKLSPSTGLIAMVKADGYGVGAIELSKTLQNQGAAYLAVAVVDEGAQLRRAGITMPIIVMNPMGTNYAALFENRLEPSVFSLRELDLLLSNAERLGVKHYPVHIKLDTGMHRLGFLPEELSHLLERLKSQDILKVASVFSHLATADCLNENEYTQAQLTAFSSMSDEIVNGLDYPIKRHVLNTAGIMRYPQYQYDFARLGIGLYGVSPIEAEKEKLAVVARLSTRIISLKDWDCGITIGYGRKGKVSKPSTIATIPIGYADGLDRHLSNGAAAFVVNGKECPVIGNICMDQCMIDVTGANAKIGDKVEIFGEKAPLERLSDTLGTIPYEILTSVSPRVKRIYFKE